MSDPIRNTDTHHMLASFVRRMVALEIEKQRIADDIKEAKREARDFGFDVKVLTELVKEEVKPQTRAAKAAHEAMCELYRASLGNLSGTPLGDAARKRFMKQDDDADRDADTSDDTDETEAEPEGQITPEEIAAARETGRADHKAGKKIIENPYVAGDPRRAAWDEGWCIDAGSDGMDIPQALRRKSKKKAAQTPPLPEQPQPAPDPDAGDDSSDEGE